MELNDLKDLVAKKVFRITDLDINRSKEFADGMGEEEMLEFLNLTSRGNISEVKGKEVDKKRHCGYSQKLYGMRLTRHGQ